MVTASDPLDYLQPCSHFPHGENRQKSASRSSAWILLHTSTHKQTHTHIKNYYYDKRDKSALSFQLLPFDPSQSAKIVFERVWL